MAIEIPMEILLSLAVFGMAIFMFSLVLEMMIRKLKDMEIYAMITVWALIQMAKRQGWDLEKDLKDLPDKKPPGLGEML